MDRLPEELLVLIAECADHASLKQCRLVNRKWHAVSTTLVFEEVMMGLFSKSLFKLGEIANSPLAKHVKSLTFFSDILPAWSKDAYLKAIDFRPPFRDWLASLSTEEREEVSREAQHRQRLQPFERYNALPRHTFSKAELDHGLAAYQATIREQIDWRSQEMGLAFKEFLSRLPNLAKVQVRCTLPFGGRTNSWPIWKTLRKDILVGPDDWMYNTDFHDHGYQFLSGLAALAVIEGVAFRSSFSGNTPVTTLSIHSAHIDSYWRLMDDERRSDKGVLKTLDLRYMRLPEAFASITNLNIHVPHATVSARLSSSGLDMAEETMIFLRAAKSVRKLNLRYGDDELSPDDDASHLEPLFEDVFWPQLEFLQLATNVSAKTLIDFLARHSATLKSLDMRDMLVHDVDHAIEQLPKVLRLEHIYIECLWDDAERVGESSVNYLCTLSRGTDFDAPYERSVKAYLLGATDRMPEIERDGGLDDPEDWQDDPDVPMYDDESSDNNQEPGDDSNVNLEHER